MGGASARLAAGGATTKRVQAAGVICVCLVLSIWSVGCGQRVGCGVSNHTLGMRGAPLLSSTAVVPLARCIFCFVSVTGSFLLVSKGGKKHEQCSGG